MTDLEAFHELCAYTLSHRDPRFIHQHVVDAFAAQTADQSTKPIALTFALVGLYLHVEKGVSGRDVQRAHMTLARRKQQWPSLPLPLARGGITVTDVLAAPPGPQRDAAIEAWAATVWNAFGDAQQVIEELLARSLP